VNLIDPARVVIGGGVANALGQDLLVPVRAMVASDVMASDLRHVDVVLAELGDDGVLLGAAVFSDMQGRDSG
jgi:predicted NBD/HSP70 family sugar kinase